MGTFAVYWPTPRKATSTLAEMIGTTRSRVSAFMNKFRRLGFIEYNGELKVNNSLLNVILPALNASLEKTCFRWLHQHLHRTSETAAR